MIFSLLLTGAPYSTQSSSTALRFARTAIAQGHSIYRVFFYHDAVLCASRLATPAQDESNICQQWQQLAAQHQIDLVVCVASALKRGIIDTTEAKRYNKDGDNLAAGFTISGLGQLMDACLASERLISFNS